MDSCMTSRILLCASLFLAVSACTDPNTSTTPPRCTRNSDCRLGELCVNNACVAGCETDRDCPDPLKCNFEIDQCDYPLADGGFRRDSGPVMALDAGRRDAAMMVRLDASVRDSAMIISTE